MRNITGLEQSLLAILDYGEKVKGFVKQEIQATGLNILNEAKASTPVDTGNLRRQSSVESLNGGYGVGVYFSADYAPYIEFGTGGSVLVPNGWEDVAIEFKGKGIRTINLPARPFLIPAFIKHSRLFEKRIEAQLKALTTV